MLRLGTPSLFLSPAAAVFLISSLQRGCIKGPGFSPNQHSLFHVKLPPAQRRWTFTRRNPSELKAWLSLRACVQVLVRCKNRPFPNFWSWERPPLWCLALYAKGSPNLKNKLMFCQISIEQNHCKGQGYKLLCHCFYLTNPSFIFLNWKSFSFSYRKCCKQLHKVLKTKLVSKLEPRICFNHVLILVNACLRVPTV